MDDYEGWWPNDQDQTGFGDAHEFGFGETTGNGHGFGETTGYGSGFGHGHGEGLGFGFGFGTMSGLGFYDGYNNEREDNDLREFKI